MVKLEIIEQLKEQASSYASTKSKEVEEWRWVYENKFAELIVLECAEVAEDYDGAHYVGTAIKQHFGVKA